MSEDPLEPWISIEGVLYDIKAGEITVDEGMEYIQSYIADLLQDG